MEHPMLLFLDSADDVEVRYWHAQGVLDGVTTNPTVLRRDGVTDRTDTITKLADLVSPGVVHAEVTEVSGPALIAEAVALAGLAPNIAVKVPILTPDGLPLLREISALVAAGVAVNCTACLSFGQVALAAKAGARYISVLFGRIDDEGGAGAEVVAQARAWLADWHLPASIVAASLRGPADVQRSMRAGAHIVSVPAPVLAKLVDHKYTRHTVQQFLDDAAFVRAGATP
jgi:transaldolase